MNKGFTLLELLVVIGIMGLLGTMSIGGYRAATRGMADRTAVDNASMFMRAAYHRAEIDRQPVAVIYWNETLQEETNTKDLIVVGKAIAVRRAGRISYVQNNYLFDEFADLNLTYRTAGNGTTGGTMYLYKMNSAQDARNPTEVYDVVYHNTTITEIDPLDAVSASGGNAMPDPGTTGEALEMSAFVKISGSGNWQPGDAYGFEFQNITLPQGYIFGNTYSTSVSNPSTSRQVIEMPSSATLKICALRPGTSGSIEAQSAGTTANPSQEVN